MNINFKNIDEIKSYLLSISDNGFVPGYVFLRNKFGKPFRRNIKLLGGYKDVVKQCGLKIKNHHKASDGHILFSYYEYLFDEYLYYNNIPHDIDGYICNENKCRYDFLIGDVYVEIWGISKGSNFYNNYSKRREDKEKLYFKLGLKLISIEGNDFRLNSNELQQLFKEKLALFGIESNDNLVEYPIFNRRKIGYWNDNTIIEELKIIIKDLKAFPTGNELRKMKRDDLGTMIVKHGGYRKFAEILGFEPKTKIFCEQRVIKELQEIKQQLGYFPSDIDLQKIKRSDLAGSIKDHGGYGYFTEKVEGQRSKKPFGYWKNEENIINELKLLISKLGRFPKYAELGLIAKGIDKSKKGMEYFEFRCKE